MRPYPTYRRRYRILLGIASPLREGQIDRTVDPAEAAPARMQFCGGWHVLEWDTAELTSIAADLSPNSGYAQFLHRRISLQPLLLYRAINRLLSPCQPRIATPAHFTWSSRERLRTVGPLC